MACSSHRAWLGAWLYHGDVVALKGGVMDLLSFRGFYSQLWSPNCGAFHDEPNEGKRMLENELQCEDQHAVETFGDMKATNPKDAIGIRKAPLSVVPMGVIAEVGIAMLEGASKYGRHNFRAIGVRSSVYFDATMRHLIDWWEGEDIDPGSGLSHVTKAIASLIVLRDAMMQGMCEDDRPPKSKEFYPALNAAAAQIVDRYADCNPVHYTINWKQG